MLPLPRLRFHAPTTVAETIELLGKLGPDARIIAGGTDLVPNMKQGLLAPRALISIQNLRDLDGIRVEQGQLIVGAATTLDTVASSALVREGARALAEAAANVGGPQHRKMGTIGGNICLDTRCRYINQTHFWREALGFCLKKDGTVCHVVAGGKNCVAAASNDTAPALIALDGVARLASARGVREVTMAAFFHADGIKNTVIEPDELLLDVRLPLGARRTSTHEKLRRRGSIDFPLLSIAVMIERREDPKLVERVEVVVSALAAKPRRLSSASNIAPGTPADAALVRSLADAAWKECKPLENVEGDAAWRREMVPVLVATALERLMT